MKKEPVGDLGMVGSSENKRDSISGGTKVLLVFAAMFLLACAYPVVDLARNIFAARSERNERIARVVRLYERSGVKASPEVLHRIETMQPRMYPIAGAGADTESIK